jgi:hypothetical protein
MNSIHKNIILRNHREGVQIEDIAKSLGYSISAVEKVIFPNGRERKELPPNIIARQKVKKVVKEWKAGQKQQGEIVTKQKKWADAGRKSWETRRLKALRQQEPIQETEEILPEKEKIEEIATTLVTMKEHRRDEAVELLKEALEYIQVGFEGIQKAIELLKNG